MFTQHLPYNVWSRCVITNTGNTLNAPQLQSGPTNCGTWWFLSKSNMQLSHHTPRHLTMETRAMFEKAVRECSQHLSTTWNHRETKSQTSLFMFDSVQAASLTFCLLSFTWTRWSQGPCVHPLAQVRSSNHMNSSPWERSPHLDSPCLTPPTMKTGAIPSTCSGLSLSSALCRKPHYVSNTSFQTLKKPTRIRVKAVSWRVNNLLKVIH